MGKEKRETGVRERRRGRAKRGRERERSRRDRVCYTKRIFKLHVREGAHVVEFVVEWFVERDEEEVGALQYQRHHLHQTNLEYRYKDPPFQCNLWLWNVS